MAAVRVYPTTDLDPNAARERLLMDARHHLIASLKPLEDANEDVLLRRAMLLLRDVVAAVRIR